MKNLTRNLRQFYFANFIGKEQLKDEQGFLTGESQVVYSEPIKAYANISGAKGLVQAEQFGETLDYDKVLVTSNVNLPITETSVLCIDKEPAKDNLGNLLYDYKVIRIAKTLNVLSIAVSKVKDEN